MFLRISRVATLTLLFPTFAIAQQSQTLRDRDPDLAASKKLAADLQQANVHQGAFYLLSRIRIADAGFSETGDLPTGTQEGRLTLTVEAPHSLYFVPRKKTIFAAHFTPGYSFFGSDDRARQFNYLARGDAHFLLNHLYLDAYALRLDGLRAHVADINRIVTARETETGVAGELKYSSRTNALFTVRLRDTEYPKNRYQPEQTADLERPLEVLDRRERNARLALRHKTLPHTALFVAGETSRYEFDRNPAYDSTRRYAGAGFAFDSGRATLTAEAGPMTLDFKDPAIRDYEGLSGRVIATRSLRKWGLHAAATRDAGFSVFVQNPFFVATTWSAGLDYKATAKLTLHLNSAHERDEYETAVQNLERTDDTSFSSGGFTYALRRVRFGGDVGWYERDSTAYGDSESGIRYGVRLSFTP